MNGQPLAMGTKSLETIYGASVRAAAERAAEARKEADRLAGSEYGTRCICDLRQHGSMQYPRYLSFAFRLYRKI